MIRAILFDCFGVIITDSLKVVIEELGQTNPNAAQKIVDIIHANNRGLIAPAESNEQIAEILGTSVEAWRKRIEEGEVKDERLLVYAAELRPTYKTALVSNIGRESLGRRFSEHELQRSFDAVVVSGDVGFVKPEAEIYLLAAKKLGVVPNECVMVDDRERHCAGAEEVGMHAILYRNFIQGKRDIEKLLLSKGQ